MKETLSSDFEVSVLLGTSHFLESVGKPLLDNAKEIIEVSERELTAVGSVESNDSALAVVRMKRGEETEVPMDNFSLVLEDIRDPGNLGTIIRTADWYGIRNIIASEETTDIYNPKVINSTMGSFLRMNFRHTSLSAFLANTSLPTFGAFLKGEDVHTVKFPKSGLIIIGNESKGISEKIEKQITHRITIPRFGQAESLNASTATAIVLDNLRRRL